MQKKEKLGEKRFVEMKLIQCLNDDDTMAIEQQNIHIYFCKYIEARNIVVSSQLSKLVYFNIKMRILKDIDKDCENRSPLLKRMQILEIFLIFHECSCEQANTFINML